MSRCMFYLHSIKIRINCFSFFCLVIQKILLFLQSQTEKTMAHNYMLRLKCMCRQSVNKRSGVIFSLSFFDILKQWHWRKFAIFASWELNEIVSSFRKSLLKGILTKHLRTFFRRLNHWKWDTYITSQPIKLSIWQWKIMAFAKNKTKWV